MIKLALPSLLGRRTDDGTSSIPARRTEGGKRGESGRRVMHREGRRRREGEKREMERRVCEAWTVFGQGAVSDGATGRVRGEGREGGARACGRPSS